MSDDESTPKIPPLKKDPHHSALAQTTLMELDTRFAASGFDPLIPWNVTSWVYTRYWMVQDHVLGLCRTPM